MNIKQYNFSNMFWDDPEFDIKNGVPKSCEIKDNGEIIFKYLNSKELNEFLKIKSKEDPKILNFMIYKKLINILKKK